MTQWRADVPEDYDSLPSWQRVQAALKPLLATLKIYGFKRELLKELADFHEDQRALFVAFLCDGEVRNGGFHQFFFNSAGFIAPESVSGYHRLGLATQAGFVQTALAMFGEPFPRIRARRQQHLGGLTKPGNSRKECDPFAALDEAYFASTKIKSFAAAGDDFVCANISVFFKM
jgi:hypothetical protein